MDAKVAHRIRAWRESRGLSIAHLALDVGVTAPAIHQWESGTTEPTLRNVTRICSALKITLSEFWGVVPRRKKAVAT